MDVSELSPHWPQPILRDLSPAEQAHKDMLDGLTVLFDSAFIGDLRNAAFEFPDSRLGVALNKKQAACKKWLVDTLHSAAGAQFKTVHLLAGWYGLLGALLLDDKRFAIEKLTLIDIDPACEAVANVLNRSQLEAGRFQFQVADIRKLDYRATAAKNLTSEQAAPEQAAPDLIINTSCEHLDDFAAWYDLIPDGQLLALQSNDYRAIPEHVNCSDTLADFARQAPMRERLFAGELTLPNYTRFMLIGRK